MTPGAYSQVIKFKDCQSGQSASQPVRQSRVTRSWCSLVCSGFQEAQQAIQSPSPLRCLHGWLRLFGYQKTHHTRRSWNLPPRNAAVPGLTKKTNKKKQESRDVPHNSASYQPSVTLLNLDNNKTSTTALVHHSTSHPISQPQDKRKTKMICPLCMILKASSPPNACKSLPPLPSPTLFAHSRRH
ncbi:hypothetical protein BD289DRAFT_430601 [Coniella lustricola]|uniref:Uncharacterized protein n=1 Tax=Coniella lustricola TaxID=2025994 RepID=A0A2T3ABY6_9PEZI|nr:hypothetical protein BD289DRAFT_430601 [Coniella lustricola]